jgi:phospholipase C
MPAPDQVHALDNIVVVLFENRSLDNVLGHLYGPEDGKNSQEVVHEERRRDDLRATGGNGKTWKVYIMDPMPLSFHGIIHYSRLKDRLATHFVPFAEFEKDAAAGTLPNFSLIEPNMAAGHGDYHPAFGRSFSDQVEIEADPPSSTLSGEAFLERVFDAYRSAGSETGATSGTPPF